MKFGNPQEIVEGTIPLENVATPERIIPVPVTVSFIQDEQPPAHLTGKDLERWKDAKRKRDARKAKGATPRAAQGPRSLADEAKDLGAQYRAAQPQQPQGQPQQPGQPGQPQAQAPAASNPLGPFADLVTGHVLLAMMDGLMPEVVVFLHKRSRPDLRAADLKLKDYQKEALEPLADAAAKRILGHVDPALLFLGAAFFMYRSNMPPAPKGQERPQERPQAAQDRATPPPRPQAPIDDLGTPQPKEKAQERPPVTAYRGGGSHSAPRPSARQTSHAASRP